MLLIALGGLLLVSGSTGIVLDQTENDMLREVPRGWDPAVSRQAASDLLIDPDTRGEGLRILERTLRNDPASAYLWCDLGDAWMMTGDLTRARYSFARARELGPELPGLLMRVANFHFGLEEIGQALICTEHVLRIAPTYEDLVFQSYDSAGIDARTVLQHGIPAEKSAARAWFRHVLETGNAPDAQLTWAWLNRHGFGSDDGAVRYLDFLARRHEYRRAQQIWSAYLGARAGDYPDGNKVFNGGFESAATGAIYDWRIEPGKGVETTFDSEVRYAGARSFKLHFAGTENIQYHQTEQAAYLDSGRYRLRAFVRASGITTDEGIRLEIVEADPPGRLLAATDSITGTRDWTKIESTFALTRAGVVKVEIVRRPSEKFDNQIDGTAWVDAVSLHRIE